VIDGARVSIAPGPTRGACARDDRAADVVRALNFAGCPILLQRAR
jgi:hypothetical protein